MFEIKDGLQQGGILSPILFIIIMDDVIKATQKRVKSLLVGYNKLQPIKVSDCAFADDLVILAEKDSDLQRKEE